MPSRSSSTRPDKCRDRPDLIDTAPARFIHRNRAGADICSASLLLPSGCGIAAVPDSELRKRYARVPGLRQPALDRSSRGSTGSGVRGRRHRALRQRMSPGRTARQLRPLPVHVLRSESRAGGPVIGALQDEPVDLARGDGFDCRYRGLLRPRGAARFVRSAGGRRCRVGGSGGGLIARNPAWSSPCPPQGSLRC